MTFHRSRREFINLAGATIAGRNGRQRLKATRTKQAAAPRVESKGAQILVLIRRRSVRPSLSRLCSSRCRRPASRSRTLADPPERLDIGNGITLHYLDEGKGTPVIFVHGWISDADYWAAEIQPFARHYRAIAYSRRYNYPNVNRARRGYSAVVAAEDLGCARRHPESRQGRDSRPFVRRLDHRRSRSGCCFWKGRGWAAPAGTTAHGCRLRRIRVILHSLRYLLTVVEH